LHVREGASGSGSLIERPGTLTHALSVIGGGDVFAGRGLDLSELAGRLVLFLLVRGGFAEGLRLFLGELLDLSTDFRAQGAAAPLEGLEFARVAGDLAFESVGAGGDVPDDAEGASHLVGHVSGR